MKEKRKQKAPRKLVSFDWAIKRLLRSKANFVVLEGFLSELFGHDVLIEKVLESETNKDAADDKLCRIDLLVNDSERGLIIIEVQYENELDYFQRMLYSASRLVGENLKEGRPYGEILPVISVNIVYFDLGQGSDYVYKGQTDFIGIHQGDHLALSENQKHIFQREQPADFFPTYYILKVNSFNDVAKDGLDEWVYFLKNETVPPGCKAKGIKEAVKILDLMKLSGQDRRAYEEYRAAQHLKASMIEYSIKRADQAEEKAEQERREKEESQRREKESQKREKEVLKKLDEALENLKKSGMSEKEARKLLGL